MLRRLSPGLLLCAALAACSGGGGSAGPASLPKTPSSSGTVPQSVTLSIRIPAPSAAGASLARRPLYVSANTNSASISVNGGKAIVTNLANGSPSCSPSSGAGRTCSVAVSASVGTDSFAVALYASTDGSGAVLSQNTISATVAAGTANTVNIVLDGVVATVALALTTTNPPVGSKATIPLTVTLKDASGEAIVGSDPFTNPITLTDSDTSGATKISPMTILKSPADASQLVVTYTGATLTQAIFSANAGGVPTSSITSATLTPQGQTSDPNAIVDWPTYGYDSQRSGFNPSTTGITPNSIANIHVAWKITNQGGGQTQPVIATNIAGHKALVIIGSFPTIYAYDAFSGALVWQTSVGKQNLQGCGDAAVAGTVQYDQALGSVFVAAGNDGASPNHVILYKLDVATGAISAKLDVTPTLLPGEATSAHTAVTLANGRLYLGTGSNCEGSTILPSWRGRVVSVDPSSMSLLSTFFTTYGQGANYGGGGVWGWGGVSADPSGNIYVAAGNAESNNTVGVPPSPPFVSTPDEQSGFGDHLIKLPADLSGVEDSNYPGFNFVVGNSDLDFTGTPVIFQPPLGSGCGLLSATQGKGGTLVINDTQHMTPALATFQLSVPSSEAYYIGNPAYSPNTGYLYAAITSSRTSGSVLPPGLAAISGCGSKIAWNAQFGPDSIAYASSGPAPRSAPTVTAGGVVFMGTPCTSDGHGGCASGGGTLGGALWAINGTSGAVLAGAKPILTTYDQIRMAPSADGLWLWVLDGSGNLYGLTVDPSVKAVQSLPGHRVPQTFKVRS